MNTNAIVQLTLKEEHYINGLTIELDEEQQAPHWLVSEPVLLGDLKSKIAEELANSIDAESDEVLVYTQKWTQIAKGDNFITFKNSGKKEVPSGDDFVHEEELFATITFDPEELTPEIVEKFIHESFLH